MKESRYLGNENQLFTARRIQFQDGMSRGVNAIELKNQTGLYATCIEDQCLNLFDFSYRGVNFAFQSKNGLVSNQFFNGGAQEFGYYWPAGMLYTCGLTSTGPGCLMEDGIFHPDHGRIGMMPAFDLSLERGEEGVTLCGTVRDALLAGHHMELHRRLFFPRNGREITIEDTVYNLEPQEAEIMILYHFNFGYPLLSPASRVIKSKGEGYDKYSDRPLPEDCFLCREPEDTKEEELYCHTTVSDENGYAYAALINDELSLGAYVKYKTDTLPLLLHWKNMCTHDYALGLEPSNSHIMGRDKERKNGTLPRLPGYGAITYRVALGVLDGKEEISAFEDSVRSLKEE